MPIGTEALPRRRGPVRPGRRLRGRLRDEQGSAVVEFLGLAFVLLVPLVYLLLFVSQVQAAAYGAVAAADQAARAAVAQERETAGASIHAVTRRTLADYGVLADQYEVSVQCSPVDCTAREPGMVSQVRVRVQVPLPVLDEVFGMQATPVAVSSEARHRVPRF